MNVWTVELRKSFGSKWFVIALCAGCLLAIVSALGAILMSARSLDEALALSDSKNPFLSIMTLFRFVMVCDYTQPTTDLFYALLPFLAAVPYGWSLANERQRGYVQNAYARTMRCRYVGAKTLAAFATGFAVVGIPVALNIVVCACFIPAFPTDVAGMIYTGITDAVMWSSAYYTDPVRYVASYVLLDAVFAGLWSAFVLLLGGVVMDAARLLAGSFLIPYLFDAFEGKASAALLGLGAEYASLSPLTFCRGVATGSTTDTPVVAAWLGALTVVCVALIVYSSRRDVL